MRFAISRKPDLKGGISPALLAEPSALRHDDASRPETRKTGPIFEGAEFSADAITLRFSHLGGGLVAPGGILKGFTVLDAQGVVHPAKAEIQGDKVMVSTTGISNPRAVRYAWANVPEGNLFNRAGLPASPFRTDF